MKRVLFVGDHPLSCTGNGNMMRAILSQLDTEKFEPCCFAINDIDPAEMNIFSPLPLPILSARGVANDDDWGSRKLLRILGTFDNIDLVFFVGLDVWRYQHIFLHIKSTQNQRKFKTAALFPYDSPFLRQDWLKCIEFFDIKMVYSKYGYNNLSRIFPDLIYFRPPLCDSEEFKEFSPKEKIEIRKKHFPSLRNDDLLIGFVGANQIRKDPLRLIKAYSLARQQDDRFFLYLHTNPSGPVFNINQFMFDCGLKTGQVFTKDPNVSKVETKLMVELYNCFDFLVNCTMQEGLSWTPIESMLCGTPCILSDSTAHKEIIQGEPQPTAMGVACKEFALLPTITGTGEAWVESKACDVKDITNAILDMGFPDIREECATNAKKFAQEWVAEIDNINDVLAPRLIASKNPNPKIDAILFAQHSSAGDVLMSTQCFKGIKERHPNKKLVYMTQKKFQNIVEANPHVDEIIDWDENLLKRYRIVYNPHGEKILPGGFNNLDDTLYSLYPFFCSVAPDDILIVPEKPEIDLPEAFIVVQTAGAQKEFRTYNYFPMVVSMLKKKHPTLNVIQIGGADDPYCEGVDLDLRGKLAWRQSAYVMQKAMMALVIDSFPSHLAGSLGTPAVVLYGPAPARVTRPRDDHSVIVNIEPERLKVCPILSNCWGRPGYNRCTSPCINTINPMTVYEKAVKMIGG